MKSLKLNSVFAIIVIALLSFSSCTVEKRVYNKGYHTESAKKIQKKKHSISTSDTQIEDAYVSTNKDVNLSSTPTMQQDEIQLKNGKTVAGKVVTTNTKTTSVFTNNTTKNIKNNQIISIKQSNNEILVPQNNAKMKAKGKNQAIDRETFLPNLLALIFGGAAFLIFLWIAVAFYFSPIISLVFALLTIGLGIAAIIFGVKGIRAGGSYKWMGIVGLATGAAACLIALIILILDIVHLAQGWKGGIYY